MQHNYPSCIELNQYRRDPDIALPLNQAPNGYNLDERAIIYEAKQA